MSSDLSKGRKPKSRAHGEGSIYQRPDKTWAGVTRYLDSETGEKKKHFSYGKTRPEALKKKQQFEADLKKGVLPSRGSITVAHWLDTWMETYKKNNVRRNTYEGYMSIVENHLKPSLGKYLLKDLRPDQVQKMFNEKTQAGLSGNRIQHIYAVLHMALEQAVKNQLISRNVCSIIDKPRKNHFEVKPWTVEQTNQFLCSVKDSRLYTLYVLACGSGLRRSELLGLQWDDIDLKKCTLTVKRTLVKTIGGIEFGPPKNEKSRRTVFLTKPVIKVLISWKARQAKEAMKWNAAFKDEPEDQRQEYNPHHLVFCDESGKPLKPDRVTRRFTEDSKRAKLPHKRFHDLRHGYATMLLESGEDIKVISELLGHSTIAITADTYAHVSQELQRKASSNLEHLLIIK